MVQDVGLPAQIDIRHFEIIQRTEILLHPQPDLEDGAPRNDEQRRLSDETGQRIIEHLRPGRLDSTLISV